MEGLPYPALSIATLLVATSSGNNLARFASEVSLSTGEGFWAPSYELSISSYPDLVIPLDAEGNLRVSYSKAPESYLAVSAVDILNGEVGTDLLDNAWALVGATAFGLGDVVPTPFSGAAPGVEIQARILGSLLDENVPYTPRLSAALLLLVGVVFGLLLLRLAAASGRVAVFGVSAAGFLLPVLALGLHGLLLNIFSIWLGWMAPAIFSFFAAVLIALLEQLRVRSQRNRVLGNLASYIPSRLAEQIAYSLPSSNINATRQDVTLLNADIRNFSAFGEAFPPEDTAAVLHFFFTKATQIIENNGGRLHEFRGDGLLAIWEGHGGEVAKNAFAAGQEMHERINGELLQTITPTGFEALAIGIGIEQGPALIGSIGPAHRRTHALLGDTVTIALRIQEMTSDLAQPLLLGECVARQLGDIKLQSQGSYLLAGLTNPHVLYAPAPTKSAVKVDRDGPRLTVVSGGR
jgi:class 3 adenylate cyclase